VEREYVMAENFHGYMLEDADSFNSSQVHNVLDKRVNRYKYCSNLPAYTQLVINQSGSYKIQTVFDGWVVYNVPADKVFQAMEYSKPTNLPF
jgi:hypothetical protein